MARVLAIIDEHGHVLGAQFGPADEPDDPDVPFTRLLQMPGQRTVEFEVPDEIGELSGPDLHKFFSHVEFSWNAVTKVPQIEVVKHPHDK